MALTPKQERFVAEYMIDLNATQAAIRAGYSAKTAQEQASRLLSNVMVSEAVAAAQQARSQTTGVTAARVLQEIARLAFFDARKLLTDEGEPIPIHQLDDDTAAGIAGLETATERGRGEDAGVTVIRKYKIADKNSALEKLAKHVGLYAMDNKQKVDALGAILAGMGRTAMPVVRD
jgi:phage terminase small subunit